MNPDIIVIGAGYSGLMAAWTAASQGARVLLLSKGAGTTHWAAGTIDVLGYRPSEPQTPVQSPLEGIERLVAEEPHHPYAYAGQTSLQYALAELERVAANQGVTYVGSLERNFMLPTPAGSLKPSAYVPESMTAGDATRSGKYLILGFTRLRDFYPALVAANLTSQGLPARGASLSLPEIDKHKTMTTVILARLLEDPAIRREVIQHAKAALTDEDRVGFPAVLGFQHAAEVIADFQRALGRPVFEIPTLPPSVPGFRLFEAFRVALLSKGARILIGSEALRASAMNGSALTVESEAAARTVRHSAERVILATGGIAGGGITTDYQGHVREVVFDLPLHVPLSRAEWFDAKFLKPGGQPIFRAGVMVNDNLQPVDGAGRVVYDNLRAAGSVLAHWDGWREKSHEGVCLATGWKAASAAK